MTPREKAELIFDKHFDLLFESDSIIEDVSVLAKDSATITVNEIIEQWEVIDVYLADSLGELNQNLKYWYEVREELTKF